MPLKSHWWDWPSGVVVKFAHSALTAQDSRVQIPGADLHHPSIHAVVASHMQNRGRLAQLLAQGQSLSPKKEKKKEKPLSSRIHLKVKSYVDATWKGGGWAEVLLTQPSPGHPHRPSRNPKALWKDVGTALP